MANAVPSVSLGGRALAATHEGKAAERQPESAAAFVARVVATPVQVDVAAAANTLRLRLVRALELLQSTTVLLDSAALTAVSRAGETQKALQDMRNLKLMHKESLEKARADRSSAAELERQGSQVSLLGLRFLQL
jgi:hypothetical protein